MGKKGKKSSRQTGGKKSGGGGGMIYSQSRSRDESRDHFRKTLKKLSHDAVVSNVRKGYLQTTVCISEYLADGPDSQIPENKLFLKSLVDEGLVSGEPRKSIYAECLRFLCELTFLHVSKPYWKS